MSGRKQCRSLTLTFKYQHFYDEKYFEGMVHQQVLKEMGFVR
jgi:hypothetical protein